jgi:heptosyltransferase-2
LLLGTRGNVEAADTIVAATRAASLVGRDRSETLPALLADIDVLVAGDTGVAHLAAALGTPTVTLFGPTDPALSAPRGPGTVVRHRVPCAPCFYRSCPIEHPCMRDITAAEVAEHVQAALRSRAVR